MCKTLTDAIKDKIKDYFGEEISDATAQYYESCLRSGESPRIGNHHRVLKMDTLGRLSVHSQHFAGTGMMGRVAPDTGTTPPLDMLTLGPRPLVGGMEYGEIDSAQIPSHPPPRESLAQVMGESAYSKTGVVGSEYLHIIGHQLGGSDTPANLVPGSHSLNTGMIPIENYVRGLRDQRVTAHYQVKFFTQDRTFMGEDGFPRTTVWAYAAEMTVVVTTADASRSFTWTLMEQDSAENNYMISQANIGSIQEQLRRFSSL